MDGDKRLPTSSGGEPHPWLEKQKDIQMLFEHDLSVLAVSIRREVGLCPTGAGNRDRLCGNRKTTESFWLCVVNDDIYTVLSSSKLADASVLVLIQGISCRDQLIGINTIPTLRESGYHYLGKLLE